MRLLLINLYIFLLGCNNLDNCELELVEVFHFDKPRMTLSITPHDEMIILGDVTKKFYCYSKNQLLWSVDLEEIFMREPLFTDEGIIIILDNGHLYYFDFEGGLINELKLEGRVKKKPVLYKNKVIISVRGTGIISVDLDEFTVDNLVSSSEELTSNQPVIHHDKLYVGDINDKLICYDLLNQTINWSIEFDGGSLQSDPVIVQESVVLIWINLLTEDTHLVKVDINSGEVTAKSTQELDFHRTPVFDEKFIYAFGPKGSIIKYDKRDLIILSDNKINSSLMTQALVTNDFLVIGTNDRNIRLINKNNLETKYKCGFSRGFGDPFIHENEVYFSTGNSLFKIADIN